MVIKCSWIINKQYHQIKLLKSSLRNTLGYRVINVLSLFLNMSPSSLLLEWLVLPTAITHMVETASKH